MKVNRITAAPDPQNLVAASYIADAARLSLTELGKLRQHRAMEALLPPADQTGGAGGSFLYSEAEFIAVRIVTSLKRAGAYVETFGAPLAISVVQKLDFCSPDTAEVHIDCRANGYLSCYVGDEAPDAAEAAGARLWRITFNVAAHRAEFRAALATMRADGVKPSGRAFANVVVEA